VWGLPVPEAGIEEPGFLEVMFSMQASILGNEDTALGQTWGWSWFKKKKKWPLIIL
jgi:hypothetical protein